VSCKREVAEAGKQTWPVVVVGERGSGLSLAARAVHDLSVRGAAPFVAVDLNGLDPDAIENRLLIAGEALIAADNAEGGTLVLDRVSEMPVKTWQTILGVLADRSVDVPRLALVLNADPSAEDTEKMVAGLNGHRVSVPSLRQRRDDIPILVCAFAFGNGGFGPGRPVSFTRAALNGLCNYRWPGNVVELRAEITKAIATAHPGTVVDVEHLSAGVRTPSAADGVPSIDLEDIVDIELASARAVFEEWMVRRALQASGGKQTRAAERLGLSRAGLFKKMKKLGL